MRLNVTLLSAWATSVPGCIQFELHFLDVLQCLAYLVACLHGQAAIIGETIEPFDYLATFAFHLFPQFWTR
jgi:hypothetical protein